jgi:hypothetical protein
MKLPHGEACIVEIARIRDYCLNRSHPRGQHKARVFEAVFGITAAHAEEFCEVLALTACQADAIIGDSDQYGTRYVIDFELKRRGRTAKVRSCWMIRIDEIVPRFVTCYIL